MNDNIETPKVVDFRNRKPYAAEPVPVDHTTPEPGEPDEATIKVLEVALAMARQGRLHGLVALGYDPVSKEFWRHITTPHIASLDNRGAAAFMLGGWQMLNDDLGDAAFWTRGYDPLVLEENFQ